MEKPTIGHIRQAFPQHHSHAVCLDFTEVAPAVEQERVDFTITNPAVYVSLEYELCAARIATRKGLRKGATASRFGGVIFITAAGRNDIIVNKHGGAIDFISTEGEGTPFTIQLAQAEPQKSNR